MKPFLFSFNRLYSKKQAATLVLLVSAIALAWQIGSGISALNLPKKAYVPPKIMPKETRLTLQSALFTKNIFGPYIPEVLPNAEIRPSSLDVQIMGILYSTNEQESQAIIRVAGGQENYYQTGDTLPGGALIKQISKEGVIVLHRGALESLSLPKNELLFNPPAKALLP